MVTLGDKIKQKLSKDYCCEICDYTTCRKSNIEHHYSSLKHKRLASGDIGDANKQILSKNKQNCDKFICEFCNKQYNSRNGLWKHKKTCTHNSDENIIISNEPTDKDLIMMLIKDNSEFKNMMMEVLKNGTHNNTTTNSHNKAFNLQFFLNETCKDAMNITDFVESIQYQLSDLEKMGEIGYVEGISNIIVKNLKALDVTQRPVHCTDKKRETIYIKDADKWEKDEENKKIRYAIKKVATKNARLIQKFKEKHPDYNEYHSKYSTQYHKLIIESFGGSGDNDLEKEDKIIRNISKNIVVDKDTTK
jgi:Txe/YoeB family toxin of Txe-Axe toxin-antitoxin module